MSQAPDENLSNPFSDEISPPGERFIEKFQEVLLAHHEAPPQLLNSLHEQTKKTLLDLRDIMMDLSERAEGNNLKYQQVIEFINGIIDAPKV
jgi:hypothetical protein